MWKEKRLNKRITLSLPINYELLETDKKESSNTVCKDMSESGLRIVLRKFYPPKTKFLLRINIEGINKMIETIAETAWSFNMRFSNMYYNGLHFLDLNSSDQKLLREYILMKGITENKD